MELTDLTITEAGNLLIGGEISSLELTRAHLDRIEAIDPLLNSFITQTPERAVARAQRSDDELKRGEQRSPLHGIPLALKDLYETDGVRTTAGSLFFADHVPNEDAVAVQKLFAAGGLSLGKLNMHEIALGLTNVNPHFGACHNPWNLSRVTGGSSGGSGAALATGLCMGSLGSDTGGSIRVPAALCGVVGLKPTYGRVSLSGVIPLSWNLDHAGPMARNVRDLAILLQVIAGYDPGDPTSVDVPVDDYLDNLGRGISGWRIGLFDDEYVESSCAPDVVQAFRQAGEVFESLRARVSRFVLPEALNAARTNGLMVVADASTFHRERLEDQAEKFGADVRLRLESGREYSVTEYILARRTQALLRWQYEQLFNQFDILLTPTTPIPAPAIEGPDAIEQARILTRFTAPFNLTGLPAISLPCGFTSDGMPIGLQMIAKPWAEAFLLQAAQAYEQAAGWYKHRPKLSILDA